ncbi:hypothetical protein K6Y31_00775 [Motilimonas cestriensis]|uniref:Uncharacterized protein n=1 Tax=Motilimonas cestriensis TaxID=2742685 RepID=A0ABS8W5J7_9GAMM|nr:hypothetical protein [Motilimonas cestriensis]MCE2593352.1 hypothetical protein [Motilimonas cestriensis]
MNITPQRDGFDVNPSLVRPQGPTEVKEDRLEGVDHPPPPPPTGDTVSISPQARELLAKEQGGQGPNKPKVSDELKEQMLSQRQQELSKGSKTNEDVKQEQIQATKDEIKKVKEALQKIQHETSEMAEKQRDQLNLALVQLNTQLLELMRS